MREIPILFSTPMVKAILEGRKTMTRRVMKKQPLIDPQTGDWIYRSPMDGSEEVHSIDFWKESRIKSSKWQPGDILWVRETWRKYYHVDEHGYTKYNDERIDFSADNPPMIPEVDGDGSQIFNKDGSEKFIPWKPSIFMPKTAARIWLEVANVKVERLHDISPGDACDEGIEYYNIDADALEGGELQADFVNYMWRDDESYEDYHFPTYADAKSSFFSLWEKINGKESLELNPWVWCVEFKVLSTEGNHTP